MPNFRKASVSDPELNKEYPHPHHGYKIAGFLPFRGTANPQFTRNRNRSACGYQPLKRPGSLGSRREAGLDRNPRGRIRQKARLTDGIDPRVIHTPHGWWFPEQAGPDHGLWQSNANVLTRNGPPYDPAMGTYQLRALLCRIYKEE
jgi:hypothetical protein